MKVKPGKYTVAGIVVAAVLIIFYLSLSILYTGQTAVVSRFGKPIRVVKEPGLIIAWPYPFNDIEVIDSRLLMLQPKPSEFLTSDKKNLILENSICYKIVDPVLFIKTVRDKKGLEMRLTDLLSSHTGLLLGVEDLSHIVNIDQEKVKFRKINDDLTALLKRDCETLGVDVYQVFIKRIMLPYENRVAVYSRMRAERDRIAKKYIAEGEEIAQKIRSEAEKKSRLLISDAKKKADIIRGEADAKAMNIYNKAYRRNVYFYKFIRSLEAYEKIFNDKTVIVLDEKSDILKTLFKGAGK